MEAVSTVSRYPCIRYMGNHSLDFCCVYAIELQMVDILAILSMVHVLLAPKVKLRLCRSFRAYIYLGMYYVVPNTGPLYFIEPSAVQRGL